MTRKESSYNHQSLPYYINRQHFIDNLLLIHTFSINIFMEGDFMNSNDLRVIKTRKNIELSFLKLLSKKTFDQITIQNILDEALINRTTFYKHYADKYELATLLCSRVFTCFCDSIEQRFCADTKEALLESVQNLYLTFQKQRETILPLFQIHTDSIHLYDDMFAFLKSRFLKKAQTQKLSANWNEDYLSTLYASFVMTSLKWCFENEVNDDLSKYVSCFYEGSRKFFEP